MKKRKGGDKAGISQALAIMAVKRTLESEKKRFDEDKDTFETWRRNEEERLRDTAKDVDAALNENKEKSAELDSLLIAIRDYIHEQKKFNERMAASVDKLKNAVVTLRSQPYDQGALNLLSNTSKSIVALAQLSSMRMEMLEFNNAPDVFASMATKRIAIWKEFEKVYKSINNGNDTMRDKFCMYGESVGMYSTNRSLTIGIFIILENAWKYAPKEDQIKIFFSEDDSRIDVIVWNMGPMVYSDELDRLTERCYRGKNARVTPGVDGKGLGLYLAKDIFNLCGVNFSITTPGNELRTIGHVEYAPFEVRLRFPKGNNRAVY